jgi:hypothetical protein
MMCWVFQVISPTQFDVGYYIPNTGAWVKVESFTKKIDAERKCCFLNGGYIEQVPEGT